MNEQLDPKFCGKQRRLLSQSLKYIIVAWDPNFAWQLI